MSRIFNMAVHGLLDRAIGFFDSLDIDGNPNDGVLNFGPLSYKYDDTPAP